MGRKLNNEAANNPTEIGQCTECEKVATVIESSDGDPHPTGTEGSCTSCGNGEFTIIGT